MTDSTTLQLPVLARERTAWLAPVAGWLTALVGVINVASAVTPELPARLRFVASLAPAQAVLVAHALAVPAGLTLIVCAFYLARRRTRALRLAVSVLVLLGVLNLVKGLDVEEALISWGLAAILVWGRHAFWVRHEDNTLGTAVRRAGVLLGSAIIAGVAAVLVASHWTMPGASLAETLREALALITLTSGHVDFDGPAKVLPLALSLVSVTALLTAAQVLFRPIAAPHVAPAGDARHLARTLVRAHGADTLAVFKLRADLQHLFSPDRRAFLSYRAHGGVLLISGDPVGPADASAEVLERAFAFAATRGLKVAVVGAGEALAEAGTAAGLRSFYIGDEAIVETADFSLEGRRIRKVRQSVSRMTKLGYATELRTLGSLADAELSELEEVSRRWLDGQPDRGFCMAMDSLRGEHLADSTVLVARGGDGTARGFLHFVPSYGVAAVSLSAMRRDRDTPNGLTEYMVVRAIEQLAERSVERISLNFAAFARILRCPETLTERCLGRLVTLANPFFQIESLYSFNAKFFPSWQPRYLLYQGALGMPRAGVAALVAEGQFPGQERLPASPLRPAA